MTPSSSPNDVIVTTCSDSGHFSSHDSSSALSPRYHDNNNSNQQQHENNNNDGKTMIREIGAGNSLDDEESTKRATSGVNVGVNTEEVNGVDVFNVMDIF